MLLFPITALSLVADGDSNNSLSSILSALIHNISFFE